MMLQHSLCKLSKKAFLLSLTTFFIDLAFIPSGQAMDIDKLLSETDETDSSSLKRKYEDKGGSASKRRKTSSLEGLLIDPGLEKSHCFQQPIEFPSVDRSLPRLRQKFFFQPAPNNDLDDENERQQTTPSQAAIPTTPSRALKTGRIWKFHSPLSKSASTPSAVSSPDHPQLYLYLMSAPKVQPGKTGFLKWTPTIYFPAVDSPKAMELQSDNYSNHTQTVSHAIIQRFLECTANPKFRTWKAIHETLGLTSHQLDRLRRKYGFFNQALDSVRARLIRESEKAQKTLQEYIRHL